MYFQQPGRALYSLLKRDKLSQAFLLIWLLPLSAMLHADQHDLTRDKLMQAMNSEIRDDAERARDANRLPLETLEFFGFQEDMTVVEIIPGGGWYSKFLAPVLAENGQYLAALGTQGLKEKGLLDLPEFQNAVLVAEATSAERPEGEYFTTLSMDPKGFEVTDADMVLTFRNYHNFTEQSRRDINEAAFNALKSGGIYGVVDHTARHMEPYNDNLRRRVDPVLAIKEIQEAGFQFVDYSKLHYRQQDDLSLEVGHEDVTGQTDRWTLKFVKP